MLELIVWLFVGWPAIIACVVLSIAGLFRKDHRLLIVGGVIAIPFTWFVSGFPQIRSLMFLSPLLLFIAAWAMSHKWEMLSWIFAVPFFLVILLFTAVVLYLPA